MGLLPYFFLGGADRFNAEHRVDQTAIVKDGCEGILAGGLVLGDHVLFEIGMDGELAGGMLELSAL